MGADSLDLVPATPPPTIADELPLNHVNPDFSCRRTELGLLEAAGTVTNRSAETLTYTIFVVFEQGGIRVADGPGFVRALEAGQTATWEAISFQDVAGDFTCRIQQVDTLRA